MNKLKKFAVVAALSLSCIALSACDTQQHEDDRGVGDAPPVDWQLKKGQDNSPKIVTGMPDGFPNISTSCVANGFRVFEQTYEQGGNFRIQKDETCKGFAK